jgi:hypothetical protein
MEHSVQKALRMVDPMGVEGFQPRGVTRTRQQLESVLGKPTDLRMFTIAQVGGKSYQLQVEAKVHIEIDIQSITLKLTFRSMFKLKLKLRCVTARMHGPSGPRPAALRTHAEHAHTRAIGDGRAARSDVRIASSAAGPPHPLTRPRPLLPMP